MSSILSDLTEQGYAIVENCLDTKLIDNIKKNINEDLIEILKKNNSKYKDNLTNNYFEAKKFTTQHKLQKTLAKSLIDKEFISEIFLSEKIFKELIMIIGPDIEYMSNFELAIVDKNIDKKDDYLIKKYHQEFWSGTGIEALQTWIPIHLLPGMGTIEVIKKSHTWGHMPHRNREPLEIPKNHESEEIDIQVGSIVIMSALTLHRTVENNHEQPRISLPITVRNFYYPNTGNLDLFNFKKLNFSFFSRLRKILGNPHYSPFRVLGQKRKDLFKKDVF